MASKRFLKKDVKQMVYDIMDECDYIIVNDGDTAKEANKLMDEAVEFYETTLPRINAAKNKADFKSLREEIEKRAIDFVTKMNQLG